MTESQTDTQSVVQRVTRSPESYDEIVDLIEQLEKTPHAQPTAVHTLVSSLIQIFGHLAKEGVFNASSTRAAKIVKWLADQLFLYTRALENLVQSPEPKVALTGFEAYMKVVLINWKYRSDWSQDSFQDVVAASLQNKHVDFAAVWSPYLSYVDVRYFLFRGILTAIESGKVDKSSETVERLFDLFELVDTIPADDRTLVKKLKFYGGKIVPSQEFIRTHGNMVKVSAQKQAFQKAWQATMSLPVNLSQLKQHLSILHVKVIPNVQKPQLLLDFLTDAYNNGGTIALLALNGLFRLIQDYNLDYPDFFKNLYALLADGSILVSSHRARFLRLLDLFLTSSHLPATIAASIVKRLARLSLFAPPSAIIAIIPFVYNQLKRFPTCMLMIHRQDAIVGPDSDPFDFNQADPLVTGAIDSSLWELQALTNHYQPNVASLAKILSQPFTKPNYQLEHFLAHSYETLYETERKRKGNGIPTIEFDPVSVFASKDDDGMSALSSWSL